MDRVTLGFLQHMGSNTLEIIKELVGPHDALGKAKSSESYLIDKVRPIELIYRGANE